MLFLNRQERQLLGRSTTPAPSSKSAIHLQYFNASKHRMFLTSEHLAQTWTIGLEQPQHQWKQACIPVPDSEQERQRKRRYPLTRRRLSQNGVWPADFVAADCASRGRKRLALSRPSDDEPAHLRLSASATAPMAQHSVRRCRGQRQEKTRNEQPVTRGARSEQSILAGDKRRQERTVYPGCLHRAGRPFQSGGLHVSGP